MKKAWFSFPVEIKAIDWPWRSNFPPEDVVPLLNEFFRYPVTFDLHYDFYEITRPDFGLVRSVMVLAPKFSEQRSKADYFAVRIYQKSTTEENSVIDLAKYSEDRIRKLIDALGPHYPKTYFLESQKFVIILQPFLFSPVCDFTLDSDISNLVELIYLSSKAKILLDYNQNHFLRVRDNHLLYVDSDYMGNNYPDAQSALEANLNQAMVFITKNNAKFLSDVLVKLANQGPNLLEFTL